MSTEFHRNRGLRTIGPLAAGIACALFVVGPAAAESGSFFKNMFDGGGSNAPTTFTPKAYDSNDAYCPDVTVTDGSAVVQSFAGAAGDSHRLRHQIVFGQLSRECTARPDGSLSVKVGVLLRAMLGPAGSPGRFETPLTFTIKHNEKALTARTRRVAVSIPAGAFQGTQTAIEDGLTVPANAALAYEIEVGMSGAAKGPARTAGRGNKSATSESSANGNSFVPRLDE